MSLCVFYNIVLGKIRHCFKVWVLYAHQALIFSQVFNCIDIPFCQDDVELMHSLSTNTYRLTTVSRCECYVKNLNLNNVSICWQNGGRFSKMNQADIAFYNQLFNPLPHKGVSPNLPKLCYLDPDDTIMFLNFLWTELSSELFSFAGAG
jgi:hypothetical protein